MDLKKIIREEIDGLEWLKVSKWKSLINTLELLSKDRELLPDEDDEYWIRKDFKLWLGETSGEDLEELNKEIDAKFRNGLKMFGVVDSLFITIDRNYLRDRDMVIVSGMGCYKDSKGLSIKNPANELALCQQINGEYKIKPGRLGYDERYFNNSNAQELSL